MGMTLKCVLLGQIALLLIKCLYPVIDVCVHNDINGMILLLTVNIHPEFNFCPSVKANDVNIICDLVMKLPFTYPFP